MDKELILFLNNILSVFCILGIAFVAFKYGKY
jgi:hypothetical protein